METVVKDLHKPALRKYPRRKLEIREIDETWQDDIVDMQLYARKNKGFKYLLTVIDVESKVAWFRSCKSKTGDSITEAIKSDLVKGSLTRKVQ